MMGYEKLDAWKVCHELTLGVYEATKPLVESEPGIAHQLRLAALLAAAKLARGAGTGSKIMFRQCAEMAAGHLSEVRYYLNIAHVMGLVSECVRGKLDALRGRANFYIWKQLCPTPPASEHPPQTEIDDG
jgi:four helix bundle protein